ncbi:hypothetical protein B0H13DRAFT_2347816 [Mycena leptocephala]|nr:hypothetical protein B0H13DRAFT_2347816 [Mycena leptocephala]
MTSSTYDGARVLHSCASDYKTRSWAPSMFTSTSTIMTTEASTSHPTTTATAAPTTTTTAAAPQTADTNPQSVPTTEPPVEHRKHGVSALVEKIVHPTRAGDHTHSHTDTVSVPVAVPGAPSDGPAHLAPGGSAVGGIM